jgi:excisionase family DNA binding protein
MSASEKPIKKTAPRTCKRCGQPINTQTESWEMKHSDDGQYATGIQHVTCPVSPELENLPSAFSPTPPLLGGGGPAYPVFLTMDQAAELIHVSKQTIRRRIRSGELPAKRLRGGQTVLIDQKDVLALLEDIVPGTEI